MATIPVDTARMRENGARTNQLPGDGRDGE
jgi:hypothetical protein